MSSEQLSRISKNSRDIAKCLVSLSEVELWQYYLKAM